MNLTERYRSSMGVWQNPSFLKHPLHSCQACFVPALLFIYLFMSNYIRLCTLRVNKSETVKLLRQALPLCTEDASKATPLCTGFWEKQLTWRSTSVAVGGYFVPNWLLSSTTGNQKLKFAPWPPWLLFGYDATH